MKRSRQIFKFLFVLSVFASLTLISSCDKSTEEIGKITEAILSISEQYKNIRLTKEGGADTISFTTNHDWKVESNSLWCKVSTSSGGSGDASFIITVSKNDSSDDRSSKITISSAKLTVTITIIQSGGHQQDNYTAIDWEKTTVSSYDESSGNLSMTFTGDIPDITQNSVVILPEDQNHAIKVITGHSVSGNTLTATTKDGNMSNLFKNIDFTLTTDPSASTFTRSYATSSNIITPSEVSIMTSTGYQVIYQATKAAYKDAYDIFSFHEDYSGEVIYEKGGQKLFFEKYVFDVNLKGLFNFRFGESSEDDNSISSFENFSFYLDGNFNIDLLLKYIAQSKYKIDERTLLKKDAIPRLKFTFTVGTVPVIITVDTDLHRRLEASADAKIEISTGSNLNFNTRIGMSYTKGKGVEPIKSFTSNHSIYHPSFNVEGSVAVKASIYPEIRFGIYKFFGPTVSPIPYAKGGIDGGVQVSEGDTYFAWTGGSNVGLDLEMGLNLDFGLWESNLWEPKPFNLADISILECPTKLELLSPNLNVEVKKGIEVDVKFKALNYSELLDSYFPSVIALVNFISESGELDKIFAVTDLNGEVSVKWIPKEMDSQLIARLVDKNGDTISQVIYAPTIKEQELFITTKATTNIKSTTATFNGEISGRDATTVRERGFVYSTTDNTPTIDADTKVSSTSGASLFLYNITDLTPATDYYVSAYAINSVDTSYGEVKKFTTTADSSNSVSVSLGGFTVADRNIGAQQGGIAYNYTNSTSHVDHKNDTFKGGYNTWSQAKTACPSGWRLPTKAEMEIIEKAMTNSDGRAYISDARGNRCYFPLSGYSDNTSSVIGYYWSSTESDDNERYACRLSVDISGSKVNSSDKSYGFSVRCIK